MKKLLSTIFITVILLASFLFVINKFDFKTTQTSFKAQAATPSTPTFPPIKITDWAKGGFEKLGNGNAAIGLLKTVAYWFIWFCSAFAVIAFIYSGIMYITSSGSPEKAEQAKKNMIWAVIALIVIMVAAVIPNWIYNILSKEAPL